jgi:hypothetical protein
MGSKWRRPLPRAAHFSPRASAHATVHTFGMESLLNQPGGRFVVRTGNTTEQHVAKTDACISAAVGRVTADSRHINSRSRAVSPVDRGHFTKSSRNIRTAPRSGICVYAGCARCHGLPGRSYLRCRPCAWLWVTMS